MDFKSNFATACDWLKKCRTTFSANQKTNRDLVARFGPALREVIGVSVCHMSYYWSVRAS